MQENTIELEIIEPQELELELEIDKPTIILARLQEKEITPTKDIQELIPDNGYDGLSKVTIQAIPSDYIIPIGTKEIVQNGLYNVNEYKNVNVEIPEKELSEKVITDNGIYNASDDNLDGYSKIEVNIEKGGYTGHLDKQGLKEIGYSDEEINYYQKFVNWDEEDDEKYKVSDYEKSLYGVINPNNFNNYANDSQIRFVPHFEISSNYNFATGHPYVLLISKPSWTYNGSNASIIFSGWTKLLTIPVFNINGVIKQFSISSGVNFKEIPPYNYSHFKNISLSSCQSIKIIKNVDFSNIIGFSSSFAYCYSLIEFINFKLNKINSLYSTFYGDKLLKKIDEIDAENISTLGTSTFYDCNSLEEIGSLKNIGKAYSTSRAANYSNYIIQLNSSPLLTHESLMNIINGLYDIKSAGIQTQSLRIGNINLAKLTAEEINLATEKGWQIN